jgi:beta-phosphoglucomutase-like phosphatase (HAD superfamily)
VTCATMVNVSSTREATRPGRFWWDRARPFDAEVGPLRAVLFGLDALADIERDGHRMAFNAAFAAHGLDVTWDADHYRRLLKIPDERGRIAADLRKRGFGRSSNELAAQLHRTKTALFEDSILDADVAPRSGLIDLVMSLFVAGVWAAVVTPGRRAWVQPLVRQLIGDGLVETIVTSDDLNSTDHSVHALALWELGITPEGALAVEGSSAGLRAASAAGLPTVMVTTHDSVGHPRYPGAAAVRSAYDGINPLLASSCARLHARWWTAQKRSAA